MSWKEKLDDFDRDWRRHERWRITATASNAVPTYVTEKRLAKLTIELPELPEDVRRAVGESIEKATRLLVDYEHARSRRKLVEYALDEALETIELLAGPGALPPMPELPAEPEDPTQDMARLGAALAAIDNPPEPQEA